MAETGGDAEERALGMLRKALELNPELPEAHFQLGKWALEHGDTGAALEHLRAALRNGENSSKVHFALSRAYRAAGKADESARHAALFQKQKQAESTR
jgi:lipopolysaccharide biosynthesis regulator YciM